MIFLLNKNKKGFSLLEVMVSLAIIAVALTAISSSNSLSIIYRARMQRLTTASLLIHGIVTELEDYYKRKGFPTNDITERECEVPKDYENIFECKYDLEGMGLTSDMVESLVQAAAETFMGFTQGEGGNISSEEKKLKTPDGTSENIKEKMQSIDLTKFALLAPLFGPDGEDLIRICNINISAILMGITGLIQFMPQIIEKVSERTRKLTITLLWREGPRDKKELKISTFIVSLPEEEIEAMRKMEQMEEMRKGMIPQPSPPQR